MGKRCIAAVLSVLSIVFITNAYAVMSPEFRSFLDDRPETKVFVDLKNSSGDIKVDVNAIKTSLENVLQSRKSNKFIIVNSEVGADMTIKGDVVEYVWSEQDPVD